VLDRLRGEVHRTLRQLAGSGLVAGTSGNVSGREGDYVVIKPSGVDYQSLTPEDLVVVNLSGQPIEGTLKPSVDTGAHLRIYHAVPGVGGVVHTHSTCATVFAVLGRPVPVYLTETADLFGGPIPVSSYIPPADERIGVEFAARASSGRYRALLMRHHGVFTAAPSAREALAAALVVEHAAQISLWVEQLGAPPEIPLEEVERLHRKYVTEYGQKPD